MARGLPAIWSGVLGTPFVVAGLYITSLREDVANEAGYPFLLFGGFVIVIGLYIHYVAAPEPPKMRDNEELIDTRNPAQRAALVKVAVGTPLLFVAAYLFYFTHEPYVYPTIALVVGLYLFSTGLHTYWTNTLTVYYVTNRRLIKEYRFISLVRQEIPFEKVRGVQERKSLVESMVGLGNVRVSSGGGSALEIVIRNIYSSTDFADEIRSYI